MAQKVITTTMGDGALAREKSKPPGPTPTVIGWYVDFPAMTVLPSPKGRRKLLFAFFSVSTAPNCKWPLQQCQLLASLAQRYAIALRGMAPFVFPLEEMLKGNSKADRTATSNAKFSVEMWRVAAVILTLQPDLLAMSIPRLIGVLDPKAVVLKCTADAGP
jgi:hypothetical protein